MKYQKKTGRSDGRYAIPEVSDRFRYGATSSYTPAQLKAVFDAANGGDTEALCLCGREILERNWDVIGALEQRADALMGADFDVQPGGDSELDAEAAKSFEKALRSAGELNGLDTFHDLIGHLTSAVVMPFAASEIIWGEGGSLEGFGNLEAHHFTLRDSFVPRLVCSEYPGGMPEEEAKNRFVFHQFRRKADPARSGKIRVLAWLHCFQNWPIKDLFSFIERFGMPFVIAKVDQNTWDNERQALHSLIRNFGPNGGGVFTKATELQLLNASNTGGDNVYFRALEFTHNAIYTLLVGQLASSGDSSGMSNGDAQSAVRQDILEADARAVEATVRAQIAAPWTAFHFNGAAVPRLHFKVEPTEDLAGFATVINTLSQAGFKADEAELSERFGLKLRYEAPAQPGMTFSAEAGEKLTRREMPVTGGAPNSFAMSAEDRKKDKTSELAEALTEWLGPLSEELSAISGDDSLSDAEFGKRLAVCAAGKKNGVTDKLERFQESEIYEGLARGMTP